MDKIKALEMLGAQAALQSGSAREMLLAEADIQDIAETGQLWCLMVPEKDDDEEQTPKKEDDAGSSPQWH
ncbi:hypothetical protein [Alteromonas sp. CYL-A6]|uniref:hypothetical protein n=1 Tax=Alteromonas nitratireducens TaxID=3390813 RepID=UPI0034BF923E